MSLTEEQRRSAERRMSRLPRLSALSITEARRTARLLEQHDRYIYDDETGGIPPLPEDHPDIDSLPFQVRLVACADERIHSAERGRSAANLEHKWLPEGIDRATWFRVSSSELPEQLGIARSRADGTSPYEDGRTYRLNTDSERFRRLWQLIDPPTELRRNAAEAERTELAICEMLYRYSRIGDEGLSEDARRYAMRPPGHNSDHIGITNEVMRDCADLRVLRDLVGRTGIEPPEESPLMVDDPYLITVDDSYMLEELSQVLSDPDWRRNMLADTGFMERVRPAVHEYVMGEFNRGYMLVGIRGMGGVPWDGWGSDKGPGSVRDRFESGQWYRVPRVSATGPVQDHVWDLGDLTMKDYADATRSAREADIDRVKALTLPGSGMDDLLLEGVTPVDSRSLEDRLAAFDREMGPAGGDRWRDLVSAGWWYRHTHAALVPEVSRATLSRASRMPGGLQYGALRNVESAEYAAMLNGAMLAAVFSHNGYDDESARDAAARFACVSPGNEVWRHLSPSGMREHLSAFSDDSKWTRTPEDIRSDWVASWGLEHKQFQELFGTSMNANEAVEFRSRARDYVDILVDRYSLIKPLFEPYEGPRLPESTEHFFTAQMATSQEMSL